jgi:ABC-type bacteriocin/lantibiotic exporter with double-glycine peptidase domain
LNIDRFTTPFTDKLCDILGLEYVPERLTFARNEHDVCISIPGYRQTKSFTCGYVSGLMVLRAYDPKACRKKFYELCLMHPEWGAGTRKISTALRQSGIGVRIRQGLTFGEISDYICDGHPIITSIQRRGEIHHWVVIYGVNKKTKEVFVAGEKFWFSPAPTVLSWKDFKKSIVQGTDYLVCWKK